MLHGKRQVFALMLHVLVAWQRIKIIKTSTVTHQLLEMAAMRCVNTFANLTSKSSPDYPRSYLTDDRWEHTLNRKLAGRACSLRVDGRGVSNADSAAEEQRGQTRSSPHS